MTKIKKQEVNKGLVKDAAADAGEAKNFSSTENYSGNFGTRQSINALAEEVLNMFLEVKKKNRKTLDNYDSVKTNTTNKS